MMSSCELASVAGVALVGIYGSTLCPSLIPDNNNNKVFVLECAPFCVSPLFMDPSEQPSTSAAQRRKQRRLRSWWRHEQQSIAAALATNTHHSAPR